MKYKKGFSLAEMLIVFLLVSIVISTFAPVMTKKVKKSADPTCVGGVKTIKAVFTSSTTWDVPSNIVGKAHIITVGAGGRGGDASVPDATTNGNTITFTGIAPKVSYGAGGGAGERKEADVTLDQEDYDIFVGKCCNELGDNTDDSAVAGFNAQTYAQGGNAGTPTGNSGNGGDGECFDVKKALAASDPDSDKNIDNEYNSIKTGFGGKFSAFNYSYNGSQYGGAGNGYTEYGNNRFTAGCGGGGGSADFTRCTQILDSSSNITGYSCPIDSLGKGGRGGDGVVIIEYKVRCD